MTVRPLDPVVVDLARLVWILAQRTDGTITDRAAEAPMLWEADRG